MLDKYLDELRSLHFRISAVIRTHADKNAWLHPGMRSIRSDLEELVARIERKLGEPSRGSASARSICEDLVPRMNYTKPSCVVHDLDTAYGRILVVGQVGDSSYEWVHERAGRIAAHSDSGYGSAELALRDGLVATLGLPSIEQLPVRSAVGSGRASPIETTNGHGPGHN